MLSTRTLIKRLLDCDLSAPIYVRLPDGRLYHIELPTEVSETFIKDGRVSDRPAENKRGVVFWTR